LLVTGQKQVKVKWRRKKGINKKNMVGCQHSTGRTLSSFQVLAFEKSASRRTSSKKIERRIKNVEIKNTVAQLSSSS